MTRVHSGRRTAERRSRAWRMGRPGPRGLEELESRLLLSSTTGYLQTDLISDQPNVATRQDTNLVNAWGMDAAPNGPFWIAANGTGLALVVSGTGDQQQTPLTLPRPGSTSGGRPTGLVFNSLPNAFLLFGGLVPSSFLISTRDGQIVGIGTSNTVQVLVDNSTQGAEFTGLALGSVNSVPFLFAADFSRGTVDVFDRTFTQVSMVGGFQDPNLDATGFAPFNIVNVGGSLLVSFARQNAAGTADVPGVGNGIIDEFDMNGNFLRRVVSHGLLNSPWGMTMAPADFGPLSGALLVGNFGDGTIHGYDLTSGALVDTLRDTNGRPVVIDGLWSLKFGNDATAGASNTLFFTAGPGSEAHGLFGSLDFSSSVGTLGTVLSVSPVSAMLGEPVTLRADVGSGTAQPTPTGTVVFREGTTTVGTVSLVSGRATLTLTNLTAGLHTFTANYSGDSNFGPSVSGDQSVRVFGNVPDGFFNERFYLTAYADVAAAVANGTLASGLDHFARFGDREGRAPSALFDPAFYLQTNPDVAAAVRNGDFASGFDHFVAFGQKEGRDPSVYFNAGFYLQRNADVAAAVRSGAVASAFDHFVRFGENEERSGIDVFDAGFYLRTNPDVAGSVGRGEFGSAYEHFLLFGNHEERAPSTEFNPAFYLGQNPTVASQIARGQFVSALDQWLKVGRAQGRPGHA